MTTTMNPPAFEHAAEPASGMNGSPWASRERSRRWWAAVAAACLAGIPCGVVLSYAALLPFYIGIFFFALFGLMVGALAYRVGAPGRPYPTAHVILGTSVIISTTFVVSLMKEGQDFPADMAARAIKQKRDIGPVTAHEFRERAASDVQGFLQAEYWPGGTIGYLRWALTSGRIEKGRFAWLEKDLKFPQARYLFALRMALSLGLLAFGVASQTWPMRASA